VGSVRDGRRVRLGAYGKAWAFLVSGAVCLVTGVVVNTAAGNPSKLSKRAVLEFGGSALLLLIIGALLLVVGVARFRRAGREDRRERARAVAHQAELEQLADARGLVEQLLAGEIPAVEQVWDVVLRPGERVLLDGRVAYSRFYGSGTPASHASASTNRPSSAAAGRMLPEHATGKAGKRTRAQEVAWALAPRWRDQQQARLVVTDQRLLCEVNTQGWLSFDHKVATAIKALPEAPGVVLEYPGTSPLCLSGPGAARVMVVLVWALYGADGLRDHPALAQVRPAAPVRPPATARSETASPPIHDAAAAAESKVAPADRDVTPVRVEPITARAPSPERPENLLAFLAASELVVAQQVAQLLRISAGQATKRLDALREQGSVSRLKIDPRWPAAYRITTEAANQVDPALPPLRAPELSRYRRDLAGAWLWMTARNGKFGHQLAILSRREMQAADADTRTATLPGRAGAMFRDETFEARGANPAPAYRDLALVQATGSWQSVDVVLSPPDPERLRRMISHPHRDQTLTQQLFVVNGDLHVRELIESIAGEVGLADSVVIEPLDPTVISGG
jgi:hypothetical protein